MWAVSQQVYPKPQPKLGKVLKVNLTHQDSVTERQSTPACMQKSQAAADKRHSSCCLNY